MLTIEQIRIHKFLERTMKKKANQDSINQEDINPAVTQNEEKLRKTVTNLMKKQKLRAVQQIVKTQDDSRPWSQDAKAKV